MSDVKNLTADQVDQALEEGGSEKGGRLTHLGKIILIVSLALALCFVTVGAVILGVGGSRDKVTKVDFGTLRGYATRTVSECEVGDIIECTFVASASGYYEIETSRNASIERLSGAELATGSVLNSSIVFISAEAGKTCTVRMKVMQIAASIPITIYAAGNT